MTAKDRKIVRELRDHVKRIEPLIKIKGTLEEYFTVYTDFVRTRDAAKRGEKIENGWSKSWATRLYKDHGFEYCVLLEVLAGVR